MKRGRIKNRKLIHNKKYDYDKVVKKAICPKRSIWCVVVAMGCGFIVNVEI